MAPNPKLGDCPISSPPTIFKEQEAQRHRGSRPNIGPDETTRSTPWAGPSCGPFPATPMPLTRHAGQSLACSIQAASWHWRVSRVRDLKCRKGVEALKHRRPLLRRRYMYTLWAIPMQWSVKGSDHPPERTGTVSFSVHSRDFADSLQCLQTIVLRPPASPKWRLSAQLSQPLKLRKPGNVFLTIDTQTPALLEMPLPGFSSNYNYIYIY